MNNVEFQKFSDFAKGEGPLVGKKVSLEQSTDRELLFTRITIRDSKFARTNSKECLTVQFMEGGEFFVIFTGSTVLLDQFKKYADKLPFRGVLKKIDKYFTLS